MQEKDEDIIWIPYKDWLQLDFQGLPLHLRTNKVLLTNASTDSSIKRTDYGIVTSKFNGKNFEISELQAGISKHSETYSYFIGFAQSTDT